MISDDTSDIQIITTATHPLMCDIQHLFNFPQDKPKTTFKKKNPKKTVAQSLLGNFHLFLWAIQLQTDTTGSETAQSLQIFGHVTSGAALLECGPPKRLHTSVLKMFREPRVCPRSHLNIHAFFYSETSENKRKEDFHNLAEKEKKRKKMHRRERKTRSLFVTFPSASAAESRIQSERDLAPPAIVQLQRKGELKFVAQSRFKIAEKSSCRFIKFTKPRLCSCAWVKTFVSIGAKLGKKQQKKNTPLSCLDVPALTGLGNALYNQASMSIKCSFSSLCLVASHPLFLLLLLPSTCYI